MARLTRSKPVLERQEHFSNFQDRLIHSRVTSTFLCACESWTFTAEFRRRIRATERRYYRKILRILFKSHVTNEEVCAKIQQAIGSHEDLLTIMKRRKLKWYGHVSSSLVPARTSLQGRVNGGRRQGRQKKRWEDNIKEWTGLEFARSQRTVENRENWRKTDCKVINNRKTRRSVFLYSTKTNDGQPGTT